MEMAHLLRAGAVDKARGWTQPAVFAVLCRAAPIVLMRAALIQ